MNSIATVAWGSLAGPESLYGSVLTLQPSGVVHLVNHLMPAGTTIQEWYSSTDYQATRDTPELPLLHGGAGYRITPAIVSVPEGTVLVEVRFFDRYRDVMRTEVLYAPDYEFSYPPHCYSYAIRLVNGGCDELHFTSLTLQEVRADG